MLRTWDRSRESTYLEPRAGPATATPVAHADVSPDGRRVAYRWLEGHTGRIRFVDTVTGERTGRDELPVYEGAGPPASGTRTAARYADYGCYDPCTRPGHRPVARPQHGPDPGATAGPRGRDLLAGLRRRQPQPARGRLGGADRAGGRRDAGSPRARRSRSRGLLQHRPGRHGGLVFEDSVDGAAETWRVIDVHTGEVRLSGDLDLRAYSATASPDGSTVAVTGQTGELVTIGLPTASSAGARPGSGRRCSGCTTPTTASGSRRARPTAR